MNNKEITPESIELSLPSNAAYVSAARLTASSIANRLNFYIDEIEDIKAAVSEACTLVIRCSEPKSRSVFKIVFSLDVTAIAITISTSANTNVDYIEDDMGIIMINALMDTVDIKTEKDGCFIMSMIKNHRENSF